MFTYSARLFFLIGTIFSTADPGGKHGQFIWEFPPVSLAITVADYSHNSDCFY
ncbi:unnamed protein product, partial [Nesidiocoris tenuis]